MKESEPSETTGTGTTGTGTTGTTGTDTTGTENGIEPDGNAAYGHKAFKRSRSHFADRITADGRDGWPVEAGRYRLVVSRACPWASRALVSRRLLGLEGALSLAVTDPIQDDRSWRFTLDEGGRDPVLGIRYLSEAYDARERDYPGGVSVPAIVDVPSGRLVTNDFQQITLDFATEWTALHRPGAPDLYPEALRDEIDEVMEGIYRDVNNGVYRAGFAAEQSDYVAAYEDVFRRLDLVSSVSRTGATSSAKPSPRRTSGCSPRWCASTPSTTDTSSATARNWPRTGSCGRTPGTCTRPPDSVTRSTSATSSSTTTGSTPASTPPASCPSAPSCPAG